MRYSIERREKEEEKQHGPRRGECASPPASGESTAHGSKGTLSQTHRGAPDTRIRVPHHRTSEKKNGEPHPHDVRGADGAARRRERFPRPAPVAPDRPRGHGAAPGPWNFLAHLLHRTNECSGWLTNPGCGGFSPPSRAYIPPFPGAVRPFSSVARHCCVVGP
jgi:hypothetical protein